jgi:signal transduction histidine kinase
MTRPALYWRNWSLTLKGVAIIAASLAMLLGSVATSYKLERQTADATAEMLRTLKVQRDIQQLHALVAEAATGVRGYLLTGLDDFLNPYRIAQVQLPAAMASLQQNIRDPEQLERLSVLLPLVRQKLAGLDALRRQYDAEPSELRASLLAGRKILNQLRDGIGAMNARESLLVESRTAAVQQALRRNVLMNAATILVGLAGAFAMLLFTIRVVRRVRLAAENAERLVNDLPLKPTGIASDELGLLADRLHATSLLLANRAAACAAASIAKTEFLSRTSHELRTPLNAILGFAQLLETDAVNHQDRQHAEHIIRAGRHLLSLIDDVLDVSRIEAGNLTLALSPVLVAPVVEEALALLKPLAAQHRVRLQPAGDCGDLAVRADRQRLVQIVLNLVSNAIKYNAAHGRVRVTTRAHEGMVAIAIADDGAGIAATLKHRLFMPFDRLGAERGKTEGVGLGLAVSRSLAEAMGGSIAADSRPGKGSVFTLSLPRSVATAPEPMAPPADAIDGGAGTARTPTVLYLDDDASSLALIETLMMRRPNWRLLTAHSAAEGLLLARQRRPDVLLVAARMAESPDGAMPSQWRGDAALAQVPVVVLGDDATSTTATRPRQMGVVGYLKKPLDLPEFFGLLDKVIA